MNETINVTIPKEIEVTGARSRKYQWDLSRLSEDQITGLLAYAFGVITQRAGAGKEGTEKLEAEQEKAKELLEGRWMPGKGGGGARLDTEEKAARAVFEALFKGEGMKAAEARKAALQETRMADYFRMVLKRETGAEPDPEILQRVVETHRTQVEDLIDEERKRLEALHKGIEISL